MASSGILSNTTRIAASLTEIASGAPGTDISEAVRTWSFTLNRTARRRNTVGGGAVVRFLNHRTGTLRFTVDDINQDVFDLFFGQSGETLYVEFRETVDTVLESSGAPVQSYVYRFSGPMQVAAGQTSAGIHQYSITVAANRDIVEERAS